MKKNIIFVDEKQNAKISKKSYFKPKLSKEKLNIKVSTGSY